MNIQNKPIQSSAFYLIITNFKCIHAGAPVYLFVYFKYFNYFSTLYIFVQNRLFYFSKI